MMIGSRFKEVRKNLGYSQKEFAKLLGIGLTTLKDYEREKFTPKTEAVLKLITLFNINPNWLLTGQGEMFLNESSQKNIGVNYGGIQIGNIIGEQIKAKQEIKYTSDTQVNEELKEINQILQEIKAKNPQAYKKVIHKLKQEAKAMKELLDLV